MKIQWLGHSCFLLTSASGVRVLTDPFDPQIGYPAPAVEADIVTTSHQHSDHNYTAVVKGNFTTVKTAGTLTLKGIEILGVPTFHDEAGGRQRGQNLLFRLTIDGLRILHCGDLGHALTPEQVKAVGAVDVLLVPVGGHYTVDAAAALGVMRALKPTVTIPMHFKTPVLDFPITTVEPFLKAAGGGRQAGQSQVELTAEHLAQQAGVLVLDYPL